MLIAGDKQPCHFNLVKWSGFLDFKLHLPCKKLSPKIIGPFKIIKRMNPVAYHLQLPASYRISSTFHVSLLKPTYPATYTEPPPPIEIDGSPAYLVKEILSSRLRGRQLQYLFDWEGYGAEEHSWVPINDILDPSLLNDFHRDHPHSHVRLQELPIKWGIL